MPPYGPLKIIGECNLPATSLDADVLIETTEANSDVAGDDLENGDLDPGDPRSERLLEDAGATSSPGPETSDGNDDQFYARAPSGRALAGTVNPYAHKDAGICKFSGFIAITG